MWFLSDTKRCHRERSEIDRLVNECEWLEEAEWSLKKGAMLCVNADLSSCGTVYRIRMTYPTYFPACPPTVEPREPGQHWSSHQYGDGGPLCLEWGPDTWREDVTGADVLRSAYKLLSSENPRGESGVRETVPTRHHLQKGQELRSEWLRLVVDSATTTFIKSLPLGMRGTARISESRGYTSWCAFMMGASIPDLDDWQNPDIPPTFSKVGFTRDVPFVRLRLPQSAGIDDVDSLLRALTTAGIDSDGIIPDAYGLVLLCCEDAKPLLLHRGKETKLYRYEVVEVASQNDGNRLPDDHAVLATKRIAIIGAGSAGCKIALSLARSGIRQFLIVDHDIVYPENLCRLALTWEDVGQHKVDALKRRLLLIHPDISVECRRIVLTGQESTATLSSALSQIGSCDLIFDATADPNTLNLLSSVATQSSVAMVWMEVYAGGIGGMVARWRPGKDPMPKDMRSKITAWLADQCVTFPESTENYVGINEEGKPIVATDADVSAIASHSVRMALDLLVQREPSMFPSSVYFIGLARSWIFKEAGHVIPLDVGEEATPVESNDVLANHTSETIDFVKGLTPEDSDASPCDATSTAQDDSLPE